MASENILMKWAKKYILKIILYIEENCICKARGIMNYTYKTHNVCASQINFDIDGDIISNISFKCGCNGNLKAISKLLEGKSVDYIESMLKGNSCGGRSTSCADQLAIAVRQALSEN